MFVLAALTAVFFLPAPGLLAQDTGQQAGQPSRQPARAVRLSYVYGTVAIAKDNQTVTSQAEANTPLFEGMTLTTADDGRAEIQFEDGSVARIAPDSSLTLKILRGSGADADAELHVNSGLAYFELQDNTQDGQIHVDFGDTTVTGSGFTILRVNDDTPPGELAVLSGDANLERTSGLELEIHGGEDVTLSADDPNGYNLAETIPPNSWDAWNSDRDQALNAELADRNNAPGNAPAGLTPDEQSNPAWDDLNATGTWYNVPGQGYVWSPDEAANPDFDPYGDGSWVDTPGFGYTWISAYSWGYLPYQFGVWNFYPGFGWGWAPGMGCRPWWNRGVYTGVNIGYAPGWYHWVHRPFAPRPGRPIPMIAVHRQPVVFNAGLPRRDRGAVVDIGGRLSAPVVNMTARSNYESGMFGPRSVSRFDVRLGSRPGYANPAASPMRPMPFDRQSYSPMRAVPGARQGYAPARQAYSPQPQGFAPGREIPGQPVSGLPGSFAQRGSFRNYSGRPSQPARGYSPPSRGSSGSRSSGGFHGGGGGGGFHGGGDRGGRR